VVDVQAKKPSSAEQRQDGSGHSLTKMRDSDRRKRLTIWLIVAYLAALAPLGAVAATSVLGVGQGDPQTLKMLLLGVFAIGYLIAFPLTLLLLLQTRPQTNAPWVLRLHWETQCWRASLGLITLEIVQGAVWAAFLLHVV
jgi:hypothetical protein